MVRHRSLRSLAAARPAACAAARPEPPPPLPRSLPPQHRLQKTIELPPFSRGCHVVTRQILEALPELNEFEGGWVGTSWCAPCCADRSRSQHTPPDIALLRPPTCRSGPGQPAGAAHLCQPHNQRKRLAGWVGGWAGRGGPTELASALASPSAHAMLSSPGPQTCPWTWPTRWTRWRPRAASASIGMTTRGRTTCAGGGEAGGCVGGVMGAPSSTNVS